MQCACATMLRMTRKNDGISLHSLLLVLLCAAMLSGVASCSPPERHSLGGFVAVDAAEGWYRSMPLEFVPQYSDSSAVYDVEVAVRHTNAFAYSTLPLAVDLLGDSTGRYRRYSVVLELADDYGSWRGTGFGTLYQCHTVVARGVSPEQARKVVVWHTLADSAVVHNITDVGIMIKKSIESETYHQ